MQRFSNLVEPWAKTHVNCPHENNCSCSQTVRKVSSEPTRQERRNPSMCTNFIQFSLITSLMTSDAKTMECMLVSILGPVPLITTCSAIWLPRHQSLKVNRCKRSFSSVFPIGNDVSPRMSFHCVCSVTLHYLLANSDSAQFNRITWVEPDFSFHRIEIH